MNYFINESKIYMISKFYTLHLGVLIRLSSVKLINTIGVIRVTH